MNEDSSVKFLNEDSADMVVELTSHDEEKNKAQQQSTCSVYRRYKWPCFVGILILCSIGIVVGSNYKLSDLTLDNKDISSMKKDILQIKVQRKKIEQDITLLFFGHGRQNKDLDKAETMLKNNTVVFDGLTKNMSALTTDYGRQIKLHLKMQYKIDNIETEDSKTFGELKQKQIDLRQKLNNMTKAQDFLNNDLRETRSKLQKDIERTVHSLRIEFEAARSKFEAKYRAIHNSQNELRENHQNLLETISEIKNYMPN